MPFDQREFEVELAPAVTPSRSPAEAPAATVIDSVLSNLIAARELLSEPRRWIKGDYCRAGSYCIYGAIHWAGEYSSIFDAEQSPTAKFLEAVAEDRILAFWNDLPSTTHADVLALFDRAISSRRGA